MTINYRVWPSLLAIPYHLWPLHITYRHRLSPVPIASGHHPLPLAMTSIVLLPLAIPCLSPITSHLLPFASGLSTIASGHHLQPIASGHRFSPLAIASHLWPSLLTSGHRFSPSPHAIAYCHCLSALSTTYHLWPSPLAIAITSHHHYRLTIFYHLFAIAHHLSALAKASGQHLLPLT